MSDSTPDQTTFQYRAQTVGGQAVSGTLDAADHATAQALLESMHLQSVELQREARPRRARMMGRDDFMAFNQQLASLTDAGLPLESGLRLIAREVHSPRLSRSVSQVADEVERGKPLGEAFEAQRSAFPPLYGRLVDAGVASNNLPGMLYGLGRHMALMNRLRAAVWQAAAYPLMVLLMLALVLGVISYVILPQFAEMYEDFDTTLPMLTELVIDSRLWLPWACGAVAVLLLLLPVFAWLARVAGVDAYIADGLLLPMPMVGPVLKRNLVTRWCDTVRLGVEAGLDLPRAMSMAAEAIDSPSLTHDTEKFCRALERGHGLASVERLSLLPPSVPSTIDLAAQQNRLPEALATLTDLYRQQAETRISAVSVLLTPMLLAVLGVMIGFFVVALFLPLIKLMQSVM